MSLSQFNFGAKNLRDLHSWFLDILNHLSTNNYNTSDWTPTISNVTGSPTITGWYHRWGALLTFTVVIDGTHSTSSSVITNLPFTALEYSAVTIHNITDNLFIGSGNVEKASKNIKIVNYSVVNKKVVISGCCKISGI